MKYTDLKKATKNKVKTTGVSAFSELELSKIYPNPEQPRKNFEVEELAADIKENGLIQPIAVVKREDGYMIVAGERRYQAHKHLNRKTIKTHIITADDQKVQELALIENIQREDLTPFEIAKYITTLWSSGNYKKKQDLAKAIGKPPSYISKAFKAVNLCDEIIEDIETNKKNIGLEILQELSRIKDERMQLEVYNKNPTREHIRNTVWIANENRKNRNVDKREDKVSPAKKEELSFGTENFYNIKEELERGIIFHPQTSYMNIAGLKTYKMYRVTIEEIME